jgi:UDP-N-acetylmuramoylalanine--D-glutamate ligase
MTNIELNINRLKNANISVIGIGRSGMAIAKLAKYIGAKVFISDKYFTSSCRENLKYLRSIGINGEIGGHTSKIYDSEILVISPGVAADSEVVLESQKRGMKVIGEIEFGSMFTDSPIIAVTGSNGKSTTVNILAEMCQTDEIHGILAGNVGLAFSEKVLEELQNPDQYIVYILEVSSFQLEFIENFHPFISIFLNISPDHLDRHKNFENYLNTKLKLTLNQTTNDYIIYNADDKILEKELKDLNPRSITFGQSKGENHLYSISDSMIINKEYATLIKLEKVGLPGQHNLYNLLAAASGAHCLGISDQKIAEIFMSFKSIPHRLETISVKNGIEFINDSKATNIDAVKVAIESFNKPIILILGGLDKGNDFSELLKYKLCIKEVFAYGEAREMISHSLSGEIDVTIIESLRDAVKISYEHGNEGDIILLSPGCASFDQFTNFEDRGEKFAYWVDELD